MTVRGETGMVIFSLFAHDYSAQENTNVFLISRGNLTTGKHVEKGGRAQKKRLRRSVCLAFDDLKAL